METPVVLSIAGSDCSAGAGLQADLKTFGALGVHGLTAATCIVAETPLVVRRIHPVPPDLLRDQLGLLLESYPITAIKTGLLCSADQITLVCDLLGDSEIPLVVDPVMIASTGTTLQNKDARRALIERLLPLASLITPNLPEAAAILERSVETSADQEEAAHALAERFQNSCYLKGGHLANSSDLRDFLVHDGRSFSFHADKIDLEQSHGTGCTLSAALAAGLSKNLQLLEAAEQAHLFTQKALRNSRSWKIPGSSERIFHLDQIQRD